MPIYNDKNVHNAPCAFTAVAFLMHTLSVFSGEQDASYPIPEDYLSSGDTSGYVMKAAEFLDRNPSSRFAPRVALDLLMVADTTANHKLADDMKACLLFEHPQSPQASLAVSLFKDAKDFRQFVMRQGDARLKKRPGALPRQFTQVVALGLGHFKNELLDDPSFLIRVHCFAEASGASRAVDMVLPALREKCLKNADLDSLVQIHFDKGINPVHKIMKFHGAGSEAAAFLEQYYLSRLSSSEEKIPEIVRILAENAITSREYEKTLVLTEPGGGEFLNDPQILFWRAWASFALCKDEQAIGYLEQIVKEHPETKWAKSASIYADGIRHYSELQKANAEELLAISEVLKKGIGAFEATLEYVNGPKITRAETYAAYLGMVPYENRFEFCLHKDNKLFLAYRTAESGSSIYIENEPNIIDYAVSGPVPVPNLSLTRDDANEGGFNFQAGFVMGTSMKEAGATSVAFFDSPYLSTPEGITTFLTFATRHSGAVPGKIITGNGVTSFLWHIPSADSPDLELREYRVTADHRLTYVKYENLCINRLEYGPKNSVQLKPPSWPERPVIKSSEFDVSAVIKLIGAICGIMESKQ